MARGYGRRRGSALSPKLIMILAAVGLVVVVGAIFFFAGQADGRRPEQTTVTVPATNVGPQEATPAAPSTTNAPTQ
jgi:ABC-type transporter Mla subunit MlaD